MSRLRAVDDFLKPDTVLVIATTQISIEGFQKGDFPRNESEILLRILRRRSPER